ncbi:MAG TPA: thermonuclease family protein [Blastocatellia bacterium]|nr:thermonuclease family protein [Blastocatellia bacterium]
MLPFKQEEIKPAEMPLRWKVGVDQRQVALYVGLALVAGFAMGFATARYIAGDEAMATPSLAKSEGDSRAETESPALSQFRRVTRILRADTVELDGAEIVRMIGIETPDGKSQYLDHGKQALAFSEKMLLGQDVRVEFDPAYSSRNHKDDEGRTLAYLYTQSGAMVNRELVRQGHAFVRVSEPFQFIEEFRSEERQAMASMRGVWGLSGSSAELASAAAGGGSASTDSTSSGERPRKLSPLLPSEIGPNLPAVSGQTAQTEPLVFVSASDRMYHKSACEYLAKKNDTLTASEARAKGYTACGRCFASTVLKVP